MDLLSRETLNSITACEYTNYKQLAKKLISIYKFIEIACKNKSSYTINKIHITTQNYDKESIIVLHKGDFPKIKISTHHSTIACYYDNLLMLKLYIKKNIMMITQAKRLYNIINDHTLDLSSEKYHIIPAPSDIILIKGNSKESPNRLLFVMNEDLQIDIFNIIYNNDDTIDKALLKISLTSDSTQNFITTILFDDNNLHYYETTRFPAWIKNQNIKNFKTINDYLIEVGIIVFKFELPF